MYELCREKPSAGDLDLAIVCNCAKSETHEVFSGVENDFKMTWRAELQRG